MLPHFLSRKRSSFADDFFFRCGIRYSGGCYLKMVSVYVPNMVNILHPIAKFRIYL